MRYHNPTPVPPEKIFRVPVALVRLSRLYKHARADMAEDVQQWRDDLLAANREVASPTSDLDLGLDILEHQTMAEMELIAETFSLSETLMGAANITATALGDPEE